MAGKTDQAKGRVKKAVGELTDDEDLKREGQIDEASGNFLSEDFSFCRRWTDMGGEIWVDHLSRLEHVGLMTYRGNMAAPLAARARRFPTSTRTQCPLQGGGRR